MSKKRFSLYAQVSSDSPSAVRPILQGLVGHGSVKQGSTPGEFLVEAEFDGENAKELNRSFLSALRRVEKKTRLRAEWTSGGVTERFFDYVLKGTSRSTTSG